MTLNWPQNIKFGLAASTFGNDIVMTWSRIQSVDSMLRARIWAELISDNKKKFVCSRADLE